MWVILSFTQSRKVIKSQRVEYFSAKKSCIEFSSLQLCSLAPLREKGWISVPEQSYHLSQLIFQVFPVNDKIKETMLQ